MHERIEDLFKTHSGTVFRICLRYLGDRDESEDLTQEIFLKADRSLSAFKGDSSIGTWIYRIAVNACLDHLRSIKRRAETYIGLLDEIVVRNITSCGDREIAKIDLDRILEQVKPEVRELLVLTQLEGMSFEEAEAVTGKKADAIAKIVSRFKKEAMVKFQLQENVKSGQRHSEKGV